MPNIRFFLVIIIINLPLGCQTKSRDNRGVGNDQSEEDRRDILTNQKLVFVRQEFDH